MIPFARARSGSRWPLLAFCVGGLTIAGCSGSNSAGLTSPARAGGSAGSRQVAQASVADAPSEVASTDEQIPEPETTDAGPTNSGPANAIVPAAAERVVGGEPAQAPVAPAHREFVVEGTERALRLGFDDLDLLKVLRMDPVTPDCVDKMPNWLRGLDGKTVRIRGFMKPGLLLEGIPQFMFVRDTGLCCFGPKGKIYDMIAVTLKEGTTTEYIELKPFDVVGKFRIELLQLEDDGTIFGLYYIDDARIVPK